MTATAQPPAAGVTLVIATYERLTSPTATSGHLPWASLAERLGVHAEREAKEDGPLWSPVTFLPDRPPRRANDNVAALSAAVLDLDHAAPHWTLLEDLEYVAHTTHSHAPGDERWRVVIPFAEPCPAESWPDTWLRIRHWYAPEADGQAKDPSRAYWWPSCRPGAERLVRTGHGAPLDWRALAPIPAELPRPAEGHPPRDGERPGHRFARETDWREILQPVGWTLVAELADGARRWRCPASDKRTGHCATTGGGGADVLYVFCEAEGQPLPSRDSVTKFRAYSLLRHGGDDRAATRELGELQRQRPQAPMSAAERLNGHAAATDVTGEPVAAAGAPMAAAEPPKQPKGQSTVLVELAAGAELFHTPAGEACASVTVAGHRETHPVRAGAFRQWLKRGYFRSRGGVPSSQAVQDAIDVLEGRALGEGPRLPVWTRVATVGEGRDERLVIDLGDETWRAVVIGRDGWRVDAVPPVRFRRSRTMLPLPEPLQGGSIAPLWRFLNVPSEDDRRLLAGLLCQFLRPDSRYPVLLFQGERGSGKTTAARVVRALVDPNVAPLRRPPRDDRDLMVAASNAWVVALDNLSGLPSWLSDSLCALATGGGIGARELFTNADEFVMEATRPVILTGIEGVIGRSDLADRAVPIQLEPIAQYRPERTFWAEFEAARPGIFGALCTALATALRELPTVQLAEMPRMADFAEWATAAESAFGWEPGAFLAAYRTARETETARRLDDSSLYAPLCALAAEGLDGWQGSATELLARLMELVGEHVRRSKGWPKEPHILSGKLRRMQADLALAGLELDFPTARVDGRKVRLITVRTPPSERKGNEASQASQRPGLPCQGRDAPEIQASRSVPGSVPDAARDAWDAEMGCQSVEGARAASAILRLTCERCGDWLTTAGACARCDVELPAESF